MEATLEQLRQQSRAELASTVRMVTAIAIGAHFVLAFEEWLRLGTLPASLIVTKVALVVIMALVIGALSTERGRDVVVFVCLSGGLLFAPLIVVHALLLNESFLAPLAAILWTMVSATLPWPLRYHLVVVVGSLVTVVVTQLLLDAPSPFTDPLVAGCFILVAASLFVAHANNRKRRELRLALAQLRESETRFRQLAEYSKDIIWVWNPGPTLEYVSPAFETYTGSNPQHLYDDALTVLDIVIPADRSRLRKAVIAISKGRSQTLDLTLLHHDGTEHAFEAWGAPVKDHRGEVIRGIGVWRDITKRRQITQNLSAQATTDPLTGLANLRFLRDVAQKELARAKRRQSALSIIIFDVDHFKAINDRFGHLAGDEVLREIARSARKVIRNSDTLARYGGDEFVALLPDTTQPQAIKVAQKLRFNITTSGTTHEGQPIKVTTSFGIGSTSNHSDSGIDIGNDDLDRLLQRADEALYRAKRAGRDCVRA